MTLLYLAQYLFPVQLGVSIPFSIVPPMPYLQQPNFFDVVPIMIDVVTNSTQTMPTCYIILGRTLLKSYQHHNVYIHVDNDYYNVVYCQNHPLSGRSSG